MDKRMTELMLVRHKILSSFISLFDFWLVTLQNQ